MADLIQALNGLTWPGAIGLSALTLGVVAIVLGYFWLLSRS